ncbi:MAG: hypothetical protein H6671_00440 [Anaerolineaceae bacterium]|nr:hypothetical protein [Anaerolineaceae bacterium]
MFKRIACVVLWLSVLIGLAACQPANVEVVTNADIVGTWMAGHYCVRFESDGTYQAAGSMAGLDIANPPDSGTYQVENGYVTLVSGLDSRDCSSGDVGIYHVTIAGAGRLEFSLQEDFCRMRRSPVTYTQLYEPMES